MTREFGSFGYEMGPSYEDSYTLLFVYDLDRFDRESIKWGREDEHRAWRECVLQLRTTGIGVRLGGGYYERFVCILSDRKEST